MTYDEGVSTTVGGFIPEFVRDKLGALTNWSVKEDSTGGATSFTDGDYVVVTTPEGEDIKAELSQGGAYPEKIQVKWSWGTEWDTANSNWGSNNKNRYSNGNVAANWYKADTDNKTKNTEAVEYWAYYADGDGFAVASQRAEGDGNDLAHMVGYAKVNPLWDYTTAASEESRYCHTQLGAGTGNKWNVVGVGGTSSETTDAHGRPNGDSNYSNYPLLQNNVVASSQYGETIIGKHDVWLRDFNDSSAHGDTVQDSNGNTIFKIHQPNGGDMPTVGFKQ